MAKGKHPVSGKGETGKYLIEVKSGKRVATINKRTGEYRDNCKIITFKRPKQVTTVRCEGEDAKAAWRAAAKRRKQCRGAKKRFVKCGGRKR